MSPQINWDDEAKSPEIKWDDSAPATANLKTGQGMEHPTDTFRVPMRTSGQEMQRKFTPIGQREQTPEQIKGQRNAVSNVDEGLLAVGSMALPFAGPMAEGAGLMPTLVKGGRLLARGAIGSGLGGYGGKQVGSLLHMPKVGEAIGSLAGGYLAGSGKMKIPDWTGLGFLNEPEEVPRVFGPTRVNPIPGGFMPPGKLETPVPMGPTRINPSAAKPNIPSMNEEGIPTRVAGTRQLIVTPQEAATNDRMLELATKKASERGMHFAGGMTPPEGRKVPRFSTPTEETEYPGPKWKKVIE